MSIDASIISRLKPVQLESPVNALAQLLQVQGAQQQNQLGQMKLDEHSRAVEKDQRRQNILAGFLPGMSTADQADRLTRGGFITEARTVAESGAKVSKEQREAEKFQLESHLKKFEIAGQIMNGVTDQASWERARAQTAQAFGPEAAAQLPDLYDPALIEQKRAQAMTVKDQLEQHWKAKGYDLDLKKATEQVRHNRASEGLTASGQAITVRGQNMTNDRATEANRIALGQKGITASTGLRKEFDDLPEVKNYKQALPAFSAIKDAVTRNTTQADINIVYGLAKLYDPTSVVREGEYATVANSPNIPERIKGYAQYLANGGRLTDKVKKEIMAEATGRMKSYEDPYTSARGNYTTISQNSGADPKLLFPSEHKSPTAAPKTAGPQAFSDAEKERRYQEWKRSQGK